VPGVAPKEFKPGEPIDIKAIKLTSTRVLLPYEYYSLPFCKPQGALHYNTENLGEVGLGTHSVVLTLTILADNEGRSDRQHSVRGLHENGGEVRAAVLYAREPGETSP